MGLFGRKKADKKKNGLDEDRHYKNGFNAKGNHIDTGTKFDLDGFDRNGYDEDGYDKRGYDLDGHDRSRHDREEFKKIEQEQNKKHKKGWFSSAGVCYICFQTINKKESFSKILDPKSVNFGEMFHTECHKDTRAPSESEQKLNSQHSCDYCLKKYKRIALWKSYEDDEKLICLNCKNKFREEKRKLPQRSIDIEKTEDEKIKQQEKIDKKGGALPQGYVPAAISNTPEINSKLNHSSENLSFQSFEGADLTGTHYKYTNLKNTNFTNANLTNCDFTGANLTETDFTGADLTNAELHNANLTGTIFAGAKLWTKLDNGSSTIRVGIDELFKSNLKGIDLPNIELINFNLTGKNFTGANLSNANMINSDHSLAIFENANLEGIKLHSCNLKNTNFTNANLTNCDLSYSDMTGVDLTDAKINGANFTNCIMIDAILENIDKSKANFSGVTFETKILTEKEEEHVKIIEEIKKIKFNTSISFNSKKVIIHPNNPNEGEISFYIEPFQGTDHFATLISGGNFDFRDDDSSQYIISIKFKKSNPEINDILVNKIRQGYPRKFKIFPSTLSIGAYWMVDSVSEEFASEILQRILTSFVRDYYT